LISVRTGDQSSCTVKTRRAVSQDRHNSHGRDANGCKTGTATAAAEAAATLANLRSNRISKTACTDTGTGMVSINGMLHKLSNSKHFTAPLAFYAHTLTDLTCCLTGVHISAGSKEETSLTEAYVR